MKANLSIDGLVIAGWMSGLISIEWMALGLGLVGGVTGGFALYKAIEALESIRLLREHVAATVDELERTARTVDEKIADL